MEREAEENRKRVSLKAIREARKERESNKPTDAEVIESIRKAVASNCPEASQIAEGYRLLQSLGINPKARREAIAILKKAENKQFAYGKRMRGIRG